jgi:hypothetical protein
MAHITRSTLLPEATCALLLSVDDERVRLYAVQQLVRRSNALGPATVIQWVRDAHISDADAVAILKLKSQFSADYLDEHTDDPTALRLYETLARDMGERTPIIRPGYWIHTNVGWGRIERIENMSGQPVEQFIRGQDQFQLRVILRPDVDAEPIIIDFVEEQITFPEGQTLYTCTKCNGFTAGSYGLVVNQHNNAAHGGVEPGVRPEKAPQRPMRILNYSVRKPSNELN